MAVQACPANCRDENQLLHFHLYNDEKFFLNDFGRTSEGHPLLSLAFQPLIKHMQHG
jgi:hypothetical protein